jgi:hypothetical protein
VAVGVDVVLVGLLVAGLRSVAASLLGVATSASREVAGAGNRRVWGPVAGDWSFVEGGAKLSAGGVVSSVGFVVLESPGSEIGGLLEMESLLSKGAGVAESFGESKLSAGVAGCRRVLGAKLSAGVSV